MYASSASARASWLISLTAAAPPRLAMKSLRSICMCAPCQQDSRVEGYFGTKRLCTTSHLLVSEHRRFAFADRQWLTAMCNQPKQLLRILHIFVAYLTIGDCRFQIQLRGGTDPVTTKASSIFNCSS